MDTKPASPIATSFPTCGEVFHFLIGAFDLPAWEDLFDALDPEKAKQRDKERAKRLSEQLRDWATENEGRTPQRSEFVDFVRDHTKRLPRGDALASVFTIFWQRVLDEHCEIARGEATFLGREATRSWYARQKAPGTIHRLYELQKLLARVAGNGGPTLAAPMDKLLASAWCGEKSENPLAMCFVHYGKSVSYGVDAKTATDWRAGKVRPSFAALGRHFRDHEHLEEIMLNFAFAGFVQQLAAALDDYVAADTRPLMHGLLIRQARCLGKLEAVLFEQKSAASHYGIEDYARYLLDRVGEYEHFIDTVRSDGGEALLDLRFADLRSYQEYDVRIANAEVPEDLGTFVGRFDEIWKCTRLNQSTLSSSGARAALTDLRRDCAQWSEQFAGPLHAIDARLALALDGAISQESLQRALDYYSSAVAESRYRAGTYTKQILREALGLAAMLHLRAVGEGPIKPWIKQMLGWWDLLGMGKDFDHELDAQRIELAGSKFTDGLHADLRRRLREALPSLGLLHWNINGMMGFSEGDHIEKLRSIPVDKRQKKPMSDTTVGREQTPLMEAIDREQLDLARELVVKGADLNFINSTGDTCVTKAFARRDYDLVLEILRRGDAPIKRTTLLRMTEKSRLSGLEQTIAHGRLDILRELARWKPGRGDTIDFDVERINGVTPLYYAAGCLAYFRMSTDEFVRAAPELLPDTQVMAPFRAWLAKDSDHLAMLDAVRKHSAKEGNPQGVLECVDYMIHGLGVDLDAPNTNDHSVLTFAAESRMQDVAAKLLASGASVNHRFRGGGTALTCAILKDDIDMAKLLLEYRADYRLFVDALGRPIYAMEMSEKLRQLIPHRP